MMAGGAGRAPRSALAASLLLLLALCVLDWANKGRQLVQRAGGFSGGQGTGRGVAPLTPGQRQQVLAARLQIASRSSPAAAQALLQANNTEGVHGAPLGAGSPAVLQTHAGTLERGELQLPPPAAPKRRSTWLNTSQPLPPLLFASAPCSGSTAVQTVARAMLLAHGVHTDDWLHWEELRKNKNSHLKRAGDETELPDAVEAQIASARERGKVFFNKLEMFLTDPATIEVLIRHEARVVNVWRSNALDFVACNIRDCFIRWIGRPVAADGSGTDLCFKRRFLDAPPLALFYTKDLAKHLGDFLNTGKWQLRQLRKAGFRSFQTVTSEALMGFGTSASKLQQSMRAWMDFLASLGIRPDAAKVRTVLEGGCGKTCAVGARPDKPHSSVIYNIQEVAAIVRNASNPALQRLLRD